MSGVNKVKQVACATCGRTHQISESELSFSLPEVAGRDQAYNLGIWAEVSADTFKRIYELWAAPDQHLEPRMLGILANELPYHPNTVGLAVEIQLTGPKTRPKFHVQAAEHSLYFEQLRGIDEHRAIEYSDPAMRKAAREVKT